MNTNNEFDGLIEAAFANAEAGIESGAFVTETARRRTRHFRLRRLTLATVVAIGGCVALLFLGDAVTILAGRFASAPATPAGLLAWTLPLVFAGAVVDMLPVWRSLTKLRRQRPSPCAASPSRHP